MSRVLAAIDTSAAARPVLSAAAALADLFRAEVDAVHVGAQGWSTALAVADAAGVHLSLVSGPAVERIVDEARQDDVVGVVVGARATPGGARPAGHVAEGVALAVGKPVVVVPPNCSYPVRLRRILVPLEAVLRTAAAAEPIVRAALAHGAEVIVLHVVDEPALPWFTDQPQHEFEAWMAEFRRRYCDQPGVRLEVRTGVVREQILALAVELAVDAIVLAWSQRLMIDRGREVRAVLEQSPIPVVLLPIDGSDPGAARRPSGG